MKPRGKGKVAIVRKYLKPFSSREGGGKGEDRCCRAEVMGHAKGTGSRRREKKGNSRPRMGTPTEFADWGGKRKGAMFGSGTLWC